MYELDVNFHFHLENCLFQLWVLYKSDLRISTTEKHFGIIRTKYL